MTTRTWLLRRRTPLKAATVALAALAALTIQAGPAAADDEPPICGYQIGGEIRAKYQGIGGETSPLGCPTSDELTTPNGRGKYNTFDGGSIYWTPTTGAHPVWGAIRDKWGELRWEEGKLGFPVGDELTNPDNLGKRQEFEGGTVYWHPVWSRGAHPVWGEIGKQWGVFGWEGGEFGYPTSDEVWDSSFHGVRQTFSGRQQIAMTWSPGVGENADKNQCRTECVGYQAPSSATWVQKTSVDRLVSNGQITVEVIPTEAGFEDAKNETDYDKVWNQAWLSVPYPKAWLTDAQGSSLYKQLACHAKYATKNSDGTHAGGEEWNLESRRPDVSWDYAMNPLFVAFHGCNWE
ncbi:DUF2599 domain-containing protein [Streptomyces sp. NPDC048258]|uniref:DUF2599 domain-containing protein n=1 Tax=Streptomyces sp. NPDC048258 TaxID=3365527 RepID=UPI003714AAC2